jgi:hypothetical protein
MQMPQLQTITRTYSSFEDARNVVVRLSDAGIASDHIGLLGHQTGGEDNTALGAGIGGAAGVATGFVMTMGSLALPGVGPIIVAGWFLSGAVAGALAGGVLGALVDAGMPHEEAAPHAAEHRLGRSVVSVRAEGAQIEQATAIMDAAMPIPTSIDNASSLAAPNEATVERSSSNDLSKVVS